MNSGILVSVLLVCAFLQSNALPSREKRGTCPEKYAKYNPKHIRCYEDHPDAQEVTLSQEIKDAIVKKHNDLRASVSPTASNMQTMVWDDTLAETARKWAMQCEPKHDKQHSEPDYPGMAISQNAAREHKEVHGGTMNAFMQAIKAFYNEVHNGAYTYGVPYQTPTDREGAGHYLTLVHALSNRVGCGEAYCPTKWNDMPEYKRRHYFQICNYAYGNNFTLPYTEGTPCSDCPGHCDASGKLCDCKGKLCFNGGKVNLNTCQCDCEGPFEGDRCEKRICPDKEMSWCPWQPLQQCPGNIWLQEKCPMSCNLCPKPCDGKTCLHGGVLDVKTCACVCQTGNSLKTVYTGDRCDVCPERDLWRCASFPQSDCTGDRQWYMDRFCPIKCGACPA